MIGLMPALAASALAFADVEVFDDPAVITAAYALATQQHADAIQRCLDMLHEEPYYPWNATPIVREHPETLIPRLTEFVRDEQQPIEARRRAVELLRKTADADDIPDMTVADELLIEQLGAESADERLEALRTLTYTRTLIGERLHEPLLACLDDRDPRVRGMAVQVCGIHRIPGAMDRFEIMYNTMPEDIDSTDYAVAAGSRQRLLFWLTRDATSLNAAYRAVQEVGIHGEPVSRSGRIALWQLMRNGSPLVRSVTGDILVKRAQTVRAFVDVNEPPPSDYNERQADAWHLVVDYIAQYGDENSLRVLRDLVSTRAFGGAAVLGLARLDPEAVREPALAMLRGEDAVNYTRAALALQRTAAGSADAEIIAALRSAASSPALERPPHDLTRYAIAHAAAAVGGHDGRRLALELIPRHAPRFGATLLWSADGRTLEGAMTRCVEIGLIDRVPDAEVLAAAEAEDVSFFYASDGMVGFMRALAEAGVSTGAYYDADRTPPRHDLLIMRLAESSRGLLAPEAASERRAGDGYIVQFVHADRLYRFTAEDRGDIYDTAALLTAVHRALDDAGRTERFHYVPTGDVIADYVFATPEAMDMLRREFALPRDDAGNAAEAAAEAAAAFEQAVRERFGAGE